MDFPSFELYCQLHGHQEDIRSVCTAGEGLLATASRDRTVRLWREQQSPLEYYQVEPEFRGHEKWATAVAAFQSDSGSNNTGLKSFLVSGSYDGKLLVWETENPSSGITCVLAGHEQQVSCVTVSAFGDVVSTSLDSTARVWRSGTCTQVLKGHTGAVLSVVVLDDGEIITGSQDTTIKRWRDGACSATLKGHTDTVRCLAVLPGVGWVSGSHDFSLRIWNSQQGVTLRELVGHTALVFGVACSPTGLIASASEDRSVRVWSAETGAALQTLAHPACVWGVTFVLPPGGTPASEVLASAGADGVLRLWSQAEERRASSAEREALQQQCLAVIQESGGGGGGGGVAPAGVEMHDPKILLSPGSHDGEVKVVREGGGGVAYTWNMSTNSWDRIGELVAPPTAGELSTAPDGGKMYLGQRYDYVFDVELDAGPARKLPFNRDQNPWDVAETWLEQEGLPLDQKEQVVNFLVQNTGVSPHAAAPVNLDPFTGGGSYTPGGGVGAGMGMPRPGHQASPLPVNYDPYTGVNSYTGASTAPPQAQPTSGRQMVFIPHSVGMLTFDSTPYEGVLKKLAEFKSGQWGEAVESAAALLIKLQAGEPLVQAQTNLECVTALLSWPVDRIFPALDLVRMLSLKHPWVASSLLEGTSLRDALEGAASSSAPPAARLTGLRLLANLPSHPALHATVLHLTPQMLDVYADSAKATSKNERLALANLLVNLSVLAKNARDNAVKMQILSAALEMLDNPEEDAEVLFRALVATGTTMHDDPEIIRFATEMDLLSKIMKFISSSVSKLADCSKDITYILESSSL